MTEAAPPPPPSTQPRRLRLAPGLLAPLGVVACAVIWGTTWFAITLQLGVVDPIVSISARFGLAAAVLFVGCLLTRRSLKAPWRAHVMFAGQGLFTFAIDYAFVYWAEQRVASAVVAVIFAALALVNLLLFRFAIGQKAAHGAWMGAALGLLGVFVLSGAELLRADLDPAAVTGVAFAMIGVGGAAIGNVFAWKGQQMGMKILPATAWAMAYGTGFLVLYGLMTGVEWRLELTPQYLWSLIYLSIMGSVVAFVIYFWVARNAGYALASYISALTPPIAMLVSVLFEDARFGLAALLGLLLVLGGQGLLIRANRKPTP